MGSNDKQLYNPKPNFGILKDDWNGFDWTKRIGYNDLINMIGKF